MAGDAAHVMSPTGGMGGNTEIKDVYNLAWKLAFVLGRKASHGFLHGFLVSYNTERRKAAAFAIQQAYSRYVNRVIKDPKVPCKKGLPDDTVELGYRYPVGASVSESNGNERIHLWEDPYAPTATA